MNKREPLLSEEMARNIMKNCAYNPGTMNPVSETRAFYESLIDSGKLRVASEIRASEFVEVSARYLRHESCPGPGDGWISRREMGKGAVAFCPGCGAKIIER